MPPEVPAAELPLPDLILPDPVVTVVGPDGVPFEARMTPVAADRIDRLPWYKRFGLVLVPLTLAGVVWGGPSGYFDVIRATTNPKPAAVALAPADGPRLFARNCAQCHGERGDGRGVAQLSIPARYFGAEPFKFTLTTGTKVPTDTTLDATLKRGIHGSSMPSFDALRDDERAALVGHVRTLARQGRYEALYQKAAKEAQDGGDDPDPVKLARKADEQCAVGDPLPLPAAFGPPTPAAVARGQTVFLAACASCHGPEGRGDGAQALAGQLKNDNGTLAQPRNLRGGVFKGGREKEQLYARIVLGIPGTPMPAGTALKPQEVDDLINYVLSLSEPTGTQTAAK